MRLCLRSLFVTPKKEKKIWVFSTHLTAQTEKTYEGRDVSVTFTQASTILNWLHSTQEEICHGHGVIICGDFNATPDTDAYKLMIKNGFKSAILENRGVETPTYPSGSWTYSTKVEEQRGHETLDYVFFKGDLKLEKVQTVGDNGVEFYDRKKRSQMLHASDHTGILARFSV